MSALEGLLLPYQVDLLRAIEQHDVVVCEKSRRIGMTWATAGIMTIMALDGTHVFYIGYTQDMTREFIDYCANWARGLNHAFGRDEFVDEGDVDAVQNYRMKLKNGCEIRTLSSRARNVRGKQGIVVIDEAAFHDDLNEVLAAALPQVMHFGKIVVLSTHLGVGNAFNVLCEEIRKGVRDYHLMKVTFADAVADGLYRAVCKNHDRAWSAEAEAAYIENVRKKQTSPAEELDCIPNASTGKYLPQTLLEARASDDARVYRWCETDAFMDIPREYRAMVAQGKLVEILEDLDFAAYARIGVGVDIGRHKDLTVLYLMGVTQNLSRETILVMELGGMPHEQQKDMVIGVCKAIPRSKYVMIDKGGMGSYLAEEAEVIFGKSVAQGIQLNTGFYALNFPKLKGSLESETLTLPKDAAILSDFAAVSVIDGIPKLPKNTQQKGRHGDAAIASLLAYVALDQDAGFAVECIAPDAAARESEGLVL